MKAKVVKFLKDCKEILVIQAVGFAWIATLGVSGEALISLIIQEFCLLVMCALVSDDKAATKTADSKKKVAKAVVTETTDYVAKEVLA